MKIDKQTQAVAARFAHELNGPLGATGHAIELLEHKLHGILTGSLGGKDNKLKEFFEAGVAASIVNTGKEIPNLQKIKIVKNEMLVRKLTSAAQKNPNVITMVKKLVAELSKDKKKNKKINKTDRENEVETQKEIKVESALKVFEMGYALKCAKMGLESGMQIVRNLRSLGDFDAKEFREGVTLEETLQIAWMMVAERAKNLQTRWQITPTPPLKANPHALVQVWMNLIVNAAQINKEGCEMTITLTKNGRTVAVIFENTGEKLPKGVDIFESGVSQRKGGRGIGLYLCKEIVEAHKGKILARSGKKSGAVFEVRLPVA